MFKLLRKLCRDEKGATAVEYGLIVALISVAALIAMGTIGTALNDIFGVVAADLANAKP